MTEHDNTTPTSNVDDETLRDEQLDSVTGGNPPVYEHCWACGVDNLVPVTTCNNCGYRHH